MRKICLTLFAVVLLVCGCGKKTETAALEDGKIYFSTITNALIATMP